MAKRKRHRADEVAAKLKQIDELAAAGRTQREIAQALGISVMTLHRWRSAQAQQPGVDHANLADSETDVTVSGHSGSELRDRIAKLRAENAQLRKLVTDLLLVKMAIEEETARLRGRGAGKCTAK